MEKNYDIALMKRLFDNKDKKNEEYKIEPIKSIDKGKMTKEEKEEYYKIGANIIKHGEYAVVTMAGGQGTRLGWNGPKGTFKLDIGPNGKYIFEILVDKLKKAKEEFETEICWYIMTSNDNNQQTIQFFKENNYFGYNKNKVKFFIQGELPLLDMQGNIVKNSDNTIKTASNGNGSVFESLRVDGMLEDMKAKGIKWVYICGVDNIMVNMIDSILLGLTVKSNSESACKSIMKNYPEEKVGIFCKKNGKTAVIEYIDMTEDMLYACDENGEFHYGESFFVSTLFNVDAIEKISEHELGYHCAIKNNMCKFEQFIFDGFEFLDSMTIMKVKREDEFAPIKNATGIDSPQTAKEIFEKRNINYK